MPVLDAPSPPDVGEPPAGLPELPDGFKPFDTGWARPACPLCRARRATMVGRLSVDLITRGHSGRARVYCDEPDCRYVLVVNRDPDATLGYRYAGVVDPKRDTAGGTYGRSETPDNPEQAAELEERRRKYEARKAGKSRGVEP